MCSLVCLRMGVFFWNFKLISFFILSWFCFFFSFFSSFSVHLMGTKANARLPNGKDKTEKNTKRQKEHLKSLFSFRFLYFLVVKYLQNIIFISNSFHLGRMCINNRNNNCNTVLLLFIDVFTILLMRLLFVFCFRVRDHDDF